MMLTDVDRQWLLAVARAAIESHVRGMAVAPAAHPEPDPALIAFIGSYSGVFVSLHRLGRLRGCIGTLDGRPEIEDAVAEAAVAASSRDPRFLPLSAAELHEVDLEISILGLAEPVTDPDTIEVGRDGLMIERGHRRGLLLPQVASEWGWTRHQFLAQTCRKAGLPEDAWKNGATILRFTADVFSERGPRAG